MKLYERQVGAVQGDLFSKEFAIQRGTKQGDPISPILSNATLETALRSLKQKWLAKKREVQVRWGQHIYLTNLRFADDLLLAGRSLKQAWSKLEELEAEAKKVGL